MKTKTKKRISYKSKALARSAQSWSGAYKMLQLLQRAECENVSSVVASIDALDILSMYKGNF